MDRYEYTHTTNRLWRKNRAGSKDVLGMLLPLCAGVDLNRNFGYHWGGVSLDPRRGTSLLCLETYMGSKPFSEEESKAIRRFIQSKPVGTFEVSCGLVTLSKGKLIANYRYQSETKYKVLRLCSRCTLHFTATVKKSYILGATLVRKSRIGKILIVLEGSLREQFADLAMENTNIG